MKIGKKIGIVELKVLELKMHFLIAWKYTKKNSKQVIGKQSSWTKRNEGYSRVKWLYDISR